MGLACTRRAPPPGSQVGAAPRLQLQARIDLGSLAEETPTRGTVRLRNDGEAPLRIADVERSRFCTGTAGAATLAPGASTPLVIACRSDLAGPLRERVVVVSNDPRQPRQEVEIAGTVVPVLALDVPAVDLATPFGQPRSVETRLVGTRAREARLILPASPPPELALALLPEAPGRPRGLRVTCLGRPAGRRVGHLELGTSLDRPARIGLSWSCRVAGTLTVTPDNLYFDLGDRRQHARVIDVRSTQAGFAIRSARVTRGPFVAARDPAVPSRVTVVVDAGRVAPDAHGVTGSLVITSNDRTEPRKEIPLLGFGRLLPRGIRVRP